MSVSERESEQEQQISTYAEYLTEMASVSLWPPLHIWTVEPHLTQWLVAKSVPGSKIPLPWETIV